MEWSVHFQNPEFMEKTRFHLIPPDMEPLVRTWCGAKEGTRILDVGCGTGYFTRLLAEDGARVTGIDREQPFIEYAEKRNEEDGLEVSYLRGDALDLPFEDASFDVVASHTFLTVIPDPEKALSEMLRVLKPGGILACVTPMSFLPEASHQGVWPPSCFWAGEYRVLYDRLNAAYEKLNPVMRYTGGVRPASVPRFLTENGLEQLSAYPLGKLFSLSNAALTREEKLSWIAFFEESERKKLDVYMRLPEMRVLFPEEKAARFRTLLQEKCDWLRENTDENSVWEWSGGANLLMTGRKPERTVPQKPEVPTFTHGGETVYGRTKYKACSPAETVRRIKTILQKNGVETEEAWIDSGVGSVCSVRITVRGTDIGQNGKGTNREYALASGYAEFMERLQTGWLLPERIRAPFDRKWMDLSEVPSAGGALLEGTVRQIRRTEEKAFSPAEIPVCLEEWAFDAREGKLAVIPFTGMNGGETCFLPESILRTYYFTNGSCAGNTQEEALVQGLSEIAERYACGRIMTGRLTPPTVPDEAFAHIPLLKNVVDTIRGMDVYDLRIMDASLGIGLPVLAAVLTDRRSAKTVLRFGAHPRFEVALERCLTEILQGRHIDRLETSPVFDMDRDADSAGPLNRFNFMKAAYGQFPVQIFGKTPSWDYAPFQTAPEDIEGLLRYMQDLCARLGWDVFARDCSFLGFPTYQLVIPGVSMVFDFGGERLKEKKMLHAFRENLTGPEPWSYDALRAARKLAVLKRGFLIENGFTFLSGLPLTPKLLGLDLDAGLLAGLTSLALFDRERAAKFFRPYCFDAAGNMTGIYPVVQLLKGKMSEDVLAAMECVCDESMLNEAVDVIRHPEKYLPVLSCPDCGSCPSAGVCKMSQLSLMQLPSPVAG